MGDVTGDGYDDLLLVFTDLSGASGFSSIRTTAVLGGKLGQFVGAHEHISPDTNSQALWGTAMCVIGDLDGDGASEYAISDPYTGFVRVYRGNPTASIFGDNLLCTVNKEQGLINPKFGASLSGAGDLNGDGYPDLLIGDSTAQTSGGPNVRIGAVYLISGYELVEAFDIAIKDTETTGSLVFPEFNADVNIGKITSIRDQTGVTGFGLQVAGGMDATGDGVPDILVTAEGIDFVPIMNHFTKSGVLLYSGRRFARPVHTLEFPVGVHAQIVPQNNQLAFGASISFVGNVEVPGLAQNGNDKGWHDVLIGDPGTYYDVTSHLSDPGYAFVFSSATGDLVEAHKGAEYTSGPNTTGSSMGHRVAAAGFVDPDAFGDYYVAEPHWRDPLDLVDLSDARGRVTLVKGKSSVGLNPSSSTNLDFEVGQSLTSKHGLQLSSSGLRLVSVPNSNTRAFGFMSFTNWDTTSGSIPNPVSLIATRYN